MNTLSFADFKKRLVHRLRLQMRTLDLRRRSAVFSDISEPGTLQRIHVINLDRRPDRWRRVRKELRRFRIRNDKMLETIVRRFSAVDARYMSTEPPVSTLIPTYTLADQLTVDPDPLLRVDDFARGRQIKMTKQEVAVALSHIEVWRLVANGDVPSALILEDDIYMPRGFARRLDAVWAAFPRTKQDTPDFDLLYLSFEEIGTFDRQQNESEYRRPRGGIWQASGYVLTREGANKLLRKLPAHGPIDLWLNLQFDDLKVFTSAHPLIEQRIDEPSTNSYSVLPVLSSVGVVTREKPLVPSSVRLPGPIIGVGPSGSGLTALAKALSMLGYSCLSDLQQLPEGEREKLNNGSRKRLFNAYVNVGN